MNELSVEALKAVRLAIESPTVPGSGSETHEPHISAEGRWPKTRDRGDGRVRRGAGPPRSRGAVFGGRGEEDDEEERAAQSEVQKYTPLGGNVELELLGRKVASFHQVGPRSHLKAIKVVCYFYSWMLIYSMRFDTRGRDGLPRVITLGMHY